jgi:hypothetical protein
LLPLPLQAYRHCCCCRPALLLLLLLLLLILLVLLLVWLHPPYGQPRPHHHPGKQHCRCE